MLYTGEAKKGGDRRKCCDPRLTINMNEQSNHSRKGRRPASKKAKKESPGPRQPKIEIPPEIKTAWADIDHPLVIAQTNLLIKKLEEEKRKEFTLSTTGLFMPEERRAELDRISRELFEESVEAMFLAYKYERKIRKKQETPEFWEAVFWKGLAPFILQRKDIARPLFKHWFSRITVEIARLEHEAESQPSPDSEIVKPSKKRAADVAKIIRELDLLKPQMYGEADYIDLKEQHPDFLSFEIADQRKDLKLRLVNIQGHRRHIRLAQELAAAKHGKNLSTIQTDWKDHKPPEFRRKLN